MLSMDFITRLPCTKYQHDSNMVVVGTLTKETHFLSIHSTFGIIQVANVFMKEIFKHHGIPKIIISDRNEKFTSAFWKTLFQGMGTNKNFSTTYHSQTDGEIERKFQILKDMLCMYVMDRPTKWEDFLHLAEISYNKKY